MRTFLTTGLVVMAVAGSAFADKPVEPTDGAHQSGAAPVKSLKAAAAKPAAVPSPQAPAVPKRVLAQQEAIKALPLVDGEWRGASRKLARDGWVKMTQSQHVATLADGTLRLIESRGYEADGAMTFNTLAVIAYDPDAKAYSMRSWSKGRASDHPLEVTASGFSWEIQSSPQMVLRYEATMKNGAWTQTAMRVPAKGEPETYVEFTVKRTAKGPATAAFWAR